MKTPMKLSIVISATLALTFLFSSFNDGGYHKIAQDAIKKYNPKRKDYVIVVDYTKNIMTERLFVIDMKNEKIVISTEVSHAWKSGVLYPSDYSNESGSNKSSKGCFITEGTKQGKFGYSMIIRGLDGGINDNAKSRAVIFHSTEKMSTAWSNGCFATSDGINKQIIDLTKNGCLVVVID
jgi:hypothetical protein